METYLYCIVLLFLIMCCKYLTYKEWKLFIIMILDICVEYEYRKYLTYKEWKRYDLTSNLALLDS